MHAQQRRRRQTSNSLLSTQQKQKQGAPALPALPQAARGVGGGVGGQQGGQLEGVGQVGQGQRLARHNVVLQDLQAGGGSRRGSGISGYVGGGWSAGRGHGTAASWAAAAAHCVPNTHSSTACTPCMHTTAPTSLLTDCSSSGWASRASGVTLRAARAVAKAWSLGANTVAWRERSLRAGARPTACGQARGARGAGA